VNCCCVAKATEDSILKEKQENLDFAIYKIIISPIFKVMTLRNEQEMTSMKPQLPWQSPIWLVSH
jgi:hypothetical protein